MANPKKIRRQQRALERLEAKLEIDGLGFAKSSHISSNSEKDAMDHHRLRVKLDLFPKYDGPVRPHPASRYL